MHSRVLLASVVTLFATACSLSELDGLTGGAPPPVDPPGAPVSETPPGTSPANPSPPAAPSAPIAVEAPATATLVRGALTTAHIKVSGEGPFSVRVLALPAGVHAADGALANAGAIDLQLTADEEATEGAAPIDVEVASPSEKTTAHVALLVRGRAGQLDRSFGKRGLVTTSFGETGVGIRSLALQRDGKIVAAGSGSNDYQIARYTSAGELDTSFDQDGKATTAFGSGATYASCVVIQEDGRMVVGGLVDQKRIGLARFMGNGALDATFGVGGKVLASAAGATDYLVASTLDGEGRFVGAGYAAPGYDSMLLRYGPNGDWDPTLRGTGRVVTAVSDGNDFASAVAIQRDGKIVVVGHAQENATDDAFVLRYTMTGQLDTTFGNNGVVLASAGGRTRATGLVILPDGKIAIAGTVGDSNTDFFVARFYGNGAPDLEFGTQGVTVTSIGSFDDNAVALTVQADGKLLVAGTSNNGSHTDFALVRYLANGTRDMDFGVDGIVVTDVSGTADYAASLVVQSDGRILVGGRSEGAGGLVNFALARYWP